jgi:hypothetical protein
MKHKNKANAATTLTEIFGIAFPMTANVQSSGTRDQMT